MVNGGLCLSLGAINIDCMELEVGGKIEMVEISLLRGLSVRDTSDSVEKRDILLAVLIVGTGLIDSMVMRMVYT